MSKNTLTTSLGFNGGDPRVRAGRTELARHTGIKQTTISDWMSLVQSDQRLQDAVIISSSPSSWFPTPNTLWGVRTHSWLD